VVLEPEAHGGGLGVAGLELEDALVVGAGANVIPEPAGVQASEAEVGGRVVGMIGDDLLQFGSGVVQVTASFEGEGEVESGLGVIGLQGEGVFVGGERLRKAAGGVSGDGEVVLGFEQRGVGLGGGAEVIEGFGGAEAFLGVDTLLNAALGFGAVTGGGFGGVLVVVAAGGGGSAGGRRGRGGP